METVSGLELRKVFRATGKNLEVISSETGTPVATIKWLYTQNAVGEHHIENFESKGYRIRQGPIILDIQEKRIQELQEAILAIKKELETYRMIIIKGVEQDHIFFNAVAAKIDMNKLLKKKK